MAALDRLTGLLGNPLFMMGSGLLGSPDNQLRGALTGLASAQGYKLTEAKLKQDEEEAERQKKLQEMQMRQLQDAQNRQDITRAMMTSANMQPGQFQSPEAQGLLRSHLAAYGDPATAEAGGLLAQRPEAAKETSLVANIRAMGLDPNSPEGRRIMMQSMLKPQTQISMGQQFPDLPKDYMWRDPTNPAAGVVPIPDSPADQARKAAAGKEQTGAGNTIARIDNVMGEVGRALSEVGATTSGLLGAATKGIPGSPAKDLAGSLTTIKANIGFNELQAMREASPTGGALGQVAVQELESLQAVIGSLDQEQSPARLAENLQKVQQHYARWRSVVEQAKQGGSPAQIVPNSSPAQSGGRVVDFNSLP